MGLFGQGGLFGPKLQQNIEQSIMPAVAVNEIMAGRLPQLKTDKVFLKKGENCCYIDKAILNMHVKKQMRGHIGRSSPGFFKGSRLGAGLSTPIEYEEIKQQKGILFITNRRVIFKSSQNAFDKQHQNLSSVEPYNNAVELQYGQKTYELIVPDGMLVSQLLHRVCQ